MRGGGEAAGADHGGSVEIDHLRDEQPVPPTWCVVECPRCRESWSLDTRDWTPALTAFAVDFVVEPILDEHRCQNVAAV